MKNISQKTNYKGEQVHTFTSQNNRKSTRGRRVQNVKLPGGGTTRIIHHPGSKSISRLIESKPSAPSRIPESKPTNKTPVKKNFINKLFGKKGK